MPRVSLPILLACWLAASVVPAVDVDPRPRLGINLAGAVDWNAEQPFADFFKLSRLWISQIGRAHV